MGLPWWVRLCGPNAGGLGLICGQGTRSHMLQLKIPHATTEDPAQPKENKKISVLMELMFQVGETDNKYVNNSDSFSK